VESVIKQDMPGRYFIDTWGCQMNVHDSEKIAGSLKSAGFLPTPTESEADLIILNTCSVREKAEEKVFAHLGRLKHLKTKRHSKNRKRVVIGLAGCVAQQEGEAVFARAPYVDFVLGTQSLVMLPEILERVLHGGERVVEIGRHPENLDFPPEQIDRVPGVKAFTTIMEGCDNFCSFCIVPFTRGRERCRPLRDIVTEATLMAERGTKEIQLLGQNVNSYVDPVAGKSFAELLDAVQQVEGIERIRFTSPHPKDFDRASMERFRDLSKLCPHMHLPAQSGSTTVLARMKRGHSREEYLGKVYEIRRLVPHIALSTDLIVGFPGETDLEFEDTLTLVQEVAFDSIFSFKYSPRPHTSASRELPDDVPDELKRQRLSRLQDMQRRIQLRKNLSLVGETVAVLVDGLSKKSLGVLSGRTPHNRVVNFPGPGDWMGQLLHVRITQAGPNSLFGESVTVPATKGC
jgi:tRNA-2-methylthio-N6-dimethylallyladenosine synthase